MLNFKTVKIATVYSKVLTAVILCGVRETDFVQKKEMKNLGWFCVFFPFEFRFVASSSSLLLQL